MTLQLRGARRRRPVEGGGEGGVTQRRTPNPQDALTGEIASVPSKVERYWGQFLSSFPPGSEPADDFVESFFFGTEPEGAREISKLVLDGQKTATGSVLWSYETDGKPVPKAGDYWIVTDGGDDPVCIIQTTDVSVIPFDEVPEEYARDGGEGDRTLVSWRRMYWDYIVSECARACREPSQATPLVMERFRVVYREPLLGSDESSVTRARS